jgi:tRNA nucleotidyltransferase (CCA-adding enzyme)
MIESFPAELLRVLRETPGLERAYLVGGCVRDWLLAIPNKDYDIEVFGLDYEPLARALSRWGRVDLVGRSFGVVKLTLPDRHVYDFGIPRRDSKTAPGHKGFQVTFDPALTPEEAAARRDYTINSLMFDPRANELLDFFGGRGDLEKRVLRHTSSAFPEDPLRVLRGMQFAARFELNAASETIALARSIKSTFGELAKERVREEWFKWAEKSVKPSLGLTFLAETGWIEHFPELNAIRAVPQDPEWHPEGDVFVHTAHCCDELVRLKGWQKADTESRIAYMMAVLTHDFGKAATTTETLKKGRMRIVSPGHEEASGKLAEQFLTRINAPRAIIERVVPLVVNHMAHFTRITDRGVRRLAKRLEPENIEGLLVVMTADAHGRPPRVREVPATVQSIAEKAEELAVRKSAPQPLLLGRHLVELGFPPGRELGEVLKRAYDAQLAGEFHDTDSGLRWLVHRSHLALPPNVRSAISAKILA